MTLEDTILAFAPMFLTLLIGAAAGAGGYYLIVKGKLHQFRVFIDKVDSALYDDAVSNEEFVEIYEAGKILAEVPK